MARNVDKNPSVAHKAMGRILLVDPSSRTIEAGIRDGVVKVSVLSSGPFFRWPKQGELWTIHKESNAWYLDNHVEEGIDISLPIEDVPPGAARIAADSIYLDSGGRLLVEGDTIGGWRNVSSASGFTTGLGSITPTPAIFTTAGNLVPITNQTMAGVVFYFAKADWQSAACTLRMKVRAQVHTNSIVPGITIAFSLYPIAAGGGGSGQLTQTIGTAVPGSTCLVVTPGSTIQARANTASFAPPTDGYYALGAYGSGTQATNSAMGLNAQLMIIND